jgi:hypothetical protein
MANASGVPDTREAVSETNSKPKRASELVRPPILLAETQAIVRRIEARIGRPFWCTGTRRVGSVCQNDVVGFYELLRGIGKQDR